jgi:hypothetical protein
MTPAEFAAQWSAFVRQERAKAQAAGVPEVADDLELVSAPKELLNLDCFPKEAAVFLVSAGLPKSCAPFLSFEAVADGPSPLIQPPGIELYSPTERPRLSSFYVIGGDGAGNPLCLDTARNGEIVMLDHEDCFRTRTFVASSVPSLAEALIALHTVSYREFMELLRALDPLAAEESSFLPAETGGSRRQGGGGDSADTKDG